MHDIVIVGAGPAGLSAAITARARNKDALIISNSPKDSPLAKASQIDNYPGLPKTSGLNLLEALVEQARSLGAAFYFGRVISILPMGESLSITTSDEVFEARSVILATGTQSLKPFAGEAEFLGRGVSYCATCDGMFYRSGTVCVVGLNSEAVAEANFLNEIGARVFYLAKELPKGLSERIAVREGSVVEVKGDMMGVTELIYKSRETGAEEAIPCNGVFILRPSIAPDALLAGLELKDGYIAVDEHGRTNIPGVFAAGDCTGKPLQIAKAVGEGQLACFSAVGFLDKAL